jgi:hypothetical protein
MAKRRQARLVSQDEGKDYPALSAGVVFGLGIGKLWGLMKGKNFFLKLH